MEEVSEEEEGDSWGDIKIGKIPKMAINQVEKKPLKERLILSLQPVGKLNGKESFPNEVDEMLIDNFDSRLEDNFEVFYNVVSILPIECDTISRWLKRVMNMWNHKPLCYHDMNNGRVDENKVVFERPYLRMQ